MDLNVQVARKKFRESCSELRARSQCGRNGADLQLGKRERNCRNVTPNKGVFSDFHFRALFDSFSFRQI
jgi:hypothetical protein